MRVGDALQRTCPVMSGVGTGGTPSTPQYTTTPAIGYPPPVPYPVTHRVGCLANQCMMWVGDHNEGRCGMIRVTDAEAMKEALNGQV